MQPRSSLAPVCALLVLAGSLQAQASQYTLTIVHDAAPGVEWIASVPVAGEAGATFFTLGSNSVAARVVVSSGNGATSLGALPWPAALASDARVADAAYGRAVVIAGSGDPLALDAAVLLWDGLQLVEIARASDHFDDGYARITDASIAPLAETIVYHVRGLTGSKLVLEGPQGTQTIWDSATSDPTVLAGIDRIEQLICGDIVVSGSRTLAGQPGFGEVVLGLFDIDTGFSFQVLHVNQNSSTDLFTGFDSWSAADEAGIVHLGGTTTPGTERTLVHRELDTAGATVLHRTLCPEPWLGFSTVAISQLGGIVFTGVARDCASQFHHGEALQCGSDPVTDRILGIGDAFAGSTVTGVELSSNGMNADGQVAFLVRLANFHQLVVRADPAPEVFSFCPEDGLSVPCPCGNSGANGRGCANSVHPDGAWLVGTGVARLTNDTFTLSATSMPNSTALFFQGEGAELRGTPFGDGVRCVSGTLIRLGQASNTAGASSFPTAGGPTVSTRGAIPAGGLVSRTYQCFYRNAANFCTTATFNVTNAVSVTWQP